MDYASCSGHAVSVDMQCGCIMHECRCFRLGCHQRCDQACQPISPCVYRRIDWSLYWHHVSQHAAVMIYVDKLMSRCRGLRDPVVDPTFVLELEHAYISPMSGLYSVQAAVPTLPTRQRLICWFD